MKRIRGDNSNNYINIIRKKWLRVVYDCSLCNATCVARLLCGIIITTVTDLFVGTINDLVYTLYGDYYVMSSRLVIKQNDSIELSI